MTEKTPTLSDWQSLADKEVKGRDLTWHTPEGIAVKPIYTGEDTEDIDPGLPGFAPYTDGGHIRLGAFCKGILILSVSDPDVYPAGTHRVPHRLGSNI